MIEFTALVLRTDHGIHRFEPVEANDIDEAATKAIADLPPDGPWFVAAVIQADTMHYIRGF